MSLQAVSSFKPLLRRVVQSTQSEAQRQFNANSCAITRVRQSAYTRMYPVKVVFANGSELNIRYDQPRAIIRVPLTEQELKSEKERNAWLSRRKVKEVIVIKKDLTDVKYDNTDYLKYI